MSHHFEKNLTPETEKAYHDKLTEALNMGHQVLKQGGTSVEAVQTAIVILEDSELFNAGKCAVFTHHKTSEMDASIMDGNSLMAGAVAGVGRVKNPIILAHAVMTQSRHVLLSGKRAEDFAREHKIPLVDSKYR